jgi:hypothetical protein
MGDRKKEMEVKKVLERLDSLIEMGQIVLATPAADRGWVDTGLAQQWRTSSLTFLSATLGSEHFHYREFEERCKWSQRHEAKRGLAILKAVREDIAGGYLQKFETLVSASVFSDFLEMAEHLLDNGYKDPAASLIGAVLEDSLRRICSNNDITVKTDDNISSLNQKLADQKSIYNRLKQREIEVWNKLRDYADHGHFDQYKQDDVKDMLRGVRSFLSEYLK